MVADTLASHRISGQIVLDVGCGTGSLLKYVDSKFSTYLGADVLRYPDFPGHLDFIKVDLDSGRVPLPDEFADTVVSVETIEHLENPRSFVRELARLAKPGGEVIVTTPNQLSLLSTATLILKGQFSAFQNTNYPAHITALLEIDLRRIFQECGLKVDAICYSHSGRIPLTPRHYPLGITKLAPRLLSDNILVLGHK